MEKRIWNQLKKAVMITAAVGILGAGAVSAAEFEAATPYYTKVNRRILLRRTDSCRWKIVHGMEK